MSVRMRGVALNGAPGGRRRTVLLSALVLAVVVGAYGIVNWRSDDSAVEVPPPVEVAVAGGSGAPSANSEAATRVGPSEIAQMVAALEPIEQVLADARDAPAMPTRTSRDQVRRLDTADLAILCVAVPAAIDADRICANTEICGNRPIEDPELMRQLRFVVDYYVPRLTRLSNHWRGLQQREMKSAADSGQVVPSPPTYPSEADAIRVVKTLYPDAPREEQIAFVARYMKQPTCSGSHMLHNGKIYELSSFKSLPVADEVFTMVQSVGLEFLAAILTLLESRGVVSPATRNAMLARASALTGPGQRRAR